jgi:hypothetical protein
MGKSTFVMAWQRARLFRVNRIERGCVAQGARQGHVSKHLELNIKNFELWQKMLVKI